MDPINAAGELKALLDRRGVALTHDEDDVWHGTGADALAAWDAFKELAAVPPDNPLEWNGFPCTVSDTDDDLLLYEAAVREQRGERPARYELSVSRQFAFTELDGEYLGMHHLTLTFKAPPDPKLPFEQESGEAGSTASAEWIAMVERSEPFTQVLKHGLVERFEFSESNI